MKLSRSIIVGSMKFQFVDYATKNYLLASSTDGSGRIEAKNIYSHHIEFVLVWCKEQVLSTIGSLRQGLSIAVDCLKICTK